MRALTHRATASHKPAKYNELQQNCPLTTASSQRERCWLAGSVGKMHVTCACGSSLQLWDSCETHYSGTYLEPQNWAARTEGPWNPMGKPVLIASSGLDSESPCLTVRKRHTDLWLPHTQVNTHTHTGEHHTYTHEHTHTHHTQVNTDTQVNTHTYHTEKERDLFHLQHLIFPTLLLWIRRQPCSSGNMIPVVTPYIVCRMGSRSPDSQTVFILCGQGTTLRGGLVYFLWCTNSTSVSGTLLPDDQHSQEPRTWSSVHQGNLDPSHPHPRPPRLLIFALQGTNTHWPQ